MLAFTGTYQASCILHSHISVDALHVTNTHLAASAGWTELASEARRQQLEHEGSIFCVST